MPYRIAGIDVHKKMLAVAVADVEVEGEYQFERRLFGSNPDHLRLLANWLIEQQVEEVVMESTAQYWKPVWGALEQYWKPTGQKREGPGPMSGTLHLAMRRGRKIAKVAMARRLAVQMYWMLRKGWDYEQVKKFGWHAGQLGTGDGVK